MIWKSKVFKTEGFGELLDVQKSFFSEIGTIDTETDK